MTNLECVVQLLKVIRMPRIFEWFNEQDIDYYGMNDLEMIYKYLKSNPDLQEEGLFSKHKQSTKDKEVEKAEEEYSQYCRNLKLRQKSDSIQPFKLWLKKFEPQVWQHKYGKLQTEARTNRAMIWKKLIWKSEDENDENPDLSKGPLFSVDEENKIARYQRWITLQHAKEISNKLNLPLDEV